MKRGGGGGGGCLNVYTKTNSCNIGWITEIPHFR
jgi:hypothetical protein